MPATDLSAGLVAALLESRPELAGVLPGDDEPWPFREWLLSSWAVALHGSDEGPRHVLFQGGPGFGKSVAAAQYGLRVAAAGGMVAAVFFRSGFAPLEDPLGVVARISGQLSTSVPGFQKEREAARMEVGAVNPLQVTVQGDVNVAGSHLAAGSSLVGLQVALPSDRPIERAWRCDISDPLKALHEKGALPNLLIIVDALDETSASVLRMLANGLTLLPTPVRVLMTSRPGTQPPIGDPAALAQVRRMTPDDATSVSAELKDAQNHDVEIMAEWVRQRLIASRGNEDEAWAAQLAQRIAAEADRTFLVAYHVTDDLVRRFPAGTAPPPASEVPLPSGGLTGVYDAFLSRLFDSTKWRSHGRPVLGLLSVARDAGLTLGMLSDPAGLNGTDVADALQDCAAFVRPDDVDGAKVWRIWHRTFAEHLQNSDAFAVRPWDWHLRLGTSLAPLALQQSASTVGLADYRGRYATQHAAAHLLDARIDPEGIAADEAVLALKEFVDSGRWVEAIVAVAGPVASAAVIERLIPLAPTVPLLPLAEGLRAEAHVLVGETARSDGFTIGQLTVNAVRIGAESLSRMLHRWADSLGDAHSLVAQWSTTRVAPERVAAYHAGGIAAVAILTSEDGPVILTGGRDGWIRSWVTSSEEAFGRWQLSPGVPISALTCHVTSAGAVVAAGAADGTYGAWLWRGPHAPKLLWRNRMDGDAVVTALAVVAREAAYAASGTLTIACGTGALEARDLMTGNRSGDPPRAPMPVLALDVLHIPSGVNADGSTAVVGASMSEGGHAVVWDPIANRDLGEVFLGGLVTCLSSPPEGNSGLLAVGTSGGEIRLWTLSVHEDGIRCEAGPSRSVGRTRKATPEAVSALAWIRDEGGLTLVAGDTAGRIHRLDPSTLGRSGSWVAAHASTVSSLVAVVGRDQGEFMSAGYDGLVKSWLPREIDAGAWPEQVLTLDVMHDSDGPSAVVCGHANGEISVRSARGGELASRVPVHSAPIWSLVWAGPSFGIVSGDGEGQLIGSRMASSQTAQDLPAFLSSELARFSGQISSLAPGIRGGDAVIAASTLFSEVAVIDEHGNTTQFLPYGGLPLGLRVVATDGEPALVVEREITDSQAVIAGERAGRELHVTARIPENGASIEPIWRLWWNDPEMLAAWETVDRATEQDSGHPLILVGLRDGALLVFDLQKVLADPNSPTPGAYQIHELWPHRAAISTLAATHVGEALIAAWTTDDGWLFVASSWDQPPLRIYLGSTILASKIARDGSILLGGTNGVTAVRFR